MKWGVIDQALTKFMNISVLSHGSRRLPDTNKGHAELSLKNTAAGYSVIYAHLQSF